MEELQFAKYKLEYGVVIKDGHTMFIKDIVKDLNRKSFLEKERHENTRPTPDTGIEWVGECDNSECTYGMVMGSIGADVCYKCNGTGTIRRVATVEEVKLFMKVVLYHKAVHANNITINGGRLEMKEGK